MAQTTRKPLGCDPRVIFPSSSILQPSCNHLATIMQPSYNSRSGSHLQGILEPPAGQIHARGMLGERQKEGRRIQLERERAQQLAL
jgi:hypothetical protein